MRLVKNTLANFAASFLGPVLALVLTPFYIRHLGLEGFGLVGFFGALTGILGVVSAAMAKVYLREVAGRSAQPAQRHTLPGMFQNFFAFFALLGLTVATGIVLLSWWISHRWVHLEHLGPSTVQACIMLIAVTLAATFPTGVCVDTLFALQEQVRANVISMSVNLATAAAAAFLVYRYNSVFSYYAATTAGMLASLCLLARRASRSLKNHLGPDIPWPPIARSLREGRQDAIRVARSSLALMWTEGVGVAITNMDRMLLSSLLPLSNLGIYGIGASVGRLVQMPCGAFLAAAFPALCQTIATSSGTSAGARQAFRQQAIVLVLACTAALPVCAIPETLLQLWIGKAEITASAAPIAVIFAIAYACLALAGAPYHLAVATGRTRYVAAANTVAIFWYPLVGYWLISRFGLLGAALLWLTYCAQGVVACTAIAIYQVDRTYCSLREAAKVLAVPLLAVLLAKVVQVAPLMRSHHVLNQLLYAGGAAALLLFAGLFLVLDAGEFAALYSRLGHNIRPISVATPKDR